MSVLLPDKGHIKTISFTHPSAIEELLGTPVSLPTTEPGTNQKEWTLTSGMFPTQSAQMAGIGYCITVWAGGKNTGASAGTVTIRLLKNGVSLGSGVTSSITAGYFWTATVRFWTPDIGAAAGDVVGLRMWASATTMNYDYNAIQVYFSRHLPEPANVPLWKTAISVTAWPTLTLGTPSVASTLGPTIYNAPNQTVVDMGVNTTFRLLSGDAGYIAKNSMSDVYTSLVSNASTTYRPYYRRSYVIDSISYRKVEIEV